MEMVKKTKRFAVLQAGRANSKARERLGDPGEMFISHLSEPGEHWDVYDVEHGGDFNSPQEHALAPRIYDVERMAVEMGDLVLIARTATLRADVMSAMHDYAAAMAVYYFAIATFEAAGARGEATRAIYGVRRILDII